jgi:ribosomal protein S18 acetylase RimI-like enzyme
MVRKILVRPFQPIDQERVHSLILEGLSEHFEIIDPTLNPDLHDIYASYSQKGSLFLVVESEDEIVGTGAMIPEGENSGRIVRVSVANSHRRLGIGRLITDHLIKAASRYAYRKIVVETNDDWYDAILLYLGCGFTKYDRRDGEVHMQLLLP